MASTTNFITIISMFETQLSSSVERDIDKLLCYLGAIQVLRNTMGGGQISRQKVLRRYTFQRYWRCEGVGGVKFSQKSIT